VGDSGTDSSASGDGSTWAVGSATDSAGADSIAACGTDVSVGSGISVGVGVDVCTKAMAPDRFVTSSAASVEITMTGAAMHSSQANKTVTTTRRTFAPRLNAPNQR
jgi:hypothetical protein